MSESLLSVGLDVGTTSAQMILSELQVENRAGSFSVPHLQITGRTIRYKSPVHFTPLLEESRIDGAALKALIEKEYAAAGICREQVDSGAVIITGETSRKENAQAVLQALSEFAGDFVVATAGPELESMLAAKGSGAVEYSEKTGKTVLHMDIGGGTSNLALIRAGKIVDAGCLNVGGRLIKLRQDGVVTYVSPVLHGLCSVMPGQTMDENQARAVAEILVQALEMAAGLREATALLEQLTTQGTAMQIPKGNCVISFSGGVADCMENRHPWTEFGDLGPVLGQTIRRSRLWTGEHLLGRETIRATVIGAGCHSTQLSGSTVFYRNVAFPMKNLPVMCLSREDVRLSPEKMAEKIRKLRAQQDVPGVLFLPECGTLDHQSIRFLAEGITEGLAGQPVWVAARQDMAKALGQSVALRLPRDAACLCIDGVTLSQGDYLDVGAPVGPAIPVVIKTLIFESEGSK